MVRLTVIFLVLLVALYAGFLSYALASPWGGSSAVGNGLLLFTGIFVVFAAVGALYTLTAAPRGVEVRGDRITVVGRWGNRRSYPSLERLNVRVVRSYRPGILSNRVVELVEVAGEDAPTRSFVAEADLFRGSMPVPRVR